MIKYVITIDLFNLFGSLENYRFPQNYCSDLFGFSWVLLIFVMSQSHLALRTSGVNVAPSIRSITASKVSLAPSQINSNPHYKPKPYIFRSNKKHGRFNQIGPDECIEQRVRFPEFNILLDHTLAVVWMCNAKLGPNPMHNSLSKEQLQWATKFLQSIRHPTHEQSDVRNVIDRMQEIAFEKHSKEMHHPKMCRSMPIIEQEKDKSRTVLRPETFTLKDVVNQMGSDKLGGYVQLMNAGENASKA